MTRARRPVISIGNVAAGGTGKTPFAFWLAQELTARGKLPSVLTRGYGRRTRGLLVVSDGRSLRASASDAGDEAALLSRLLPDVPVVAHERRAVAAAAAEEIRPEIALHLLDDGFSHVALARDVDVVLLDAANPDAGGALLPAGRLREPVESLARADVVVVTKTESADPEPALALARRHAPGAPVYLARTEVLGLVDADGDAVSPDELPPRSFVAAAGIARPDAFFSTLERLGLEPAATLAFPDHAAYSLRRLAALVRACDESGAGALLVTEKDLVKLAGRVDRPLVALRVRTRVSDAGFVDEILARAARLPS